MRMMASSFQKSSEFSGRGCCIIVFVLILCFLLCCCVAVVCTRHRLPMHAPRDLLHGTPLPRDNLKSEVPHIPQSKISRDAQTRRHTAVKFAHHALHAPWASSRSNTIPTPTAHPIPVSKSAATQAAYIQFSGLIVTRESTLTGDDRY